MHNVASSPADSTSKKPRKRTRKSEPTEAELVAQVVAARKRLRDSRTRTRNKAIARLGTLAFQAGLAPADDDELKDGFADLAKRLLHGAGLVLLHTVGLVVLALTLHACVSPTDPLHDNPTLQRFRQDWLRAFDSPAGLAEFHRRWQKVAPRTVDTPGLPQCIPDEGNLCI